MAKKSSKRLQGCRARTGARAPASRLRTLFQTVKSVLTRAFAAETPSCLEKLDLRYVKLSELERAAEPLLREWQELKVAVMPIATVLDYLRFPLPEREVRILTYMLSQGEAMSIAIPLDVDPSRTKPCEGNRVVILASDRVLTRLAATLYSWF